MKSWGGASCRISSRCQVDQSAPLPGTNREILVVLDRYCQACSPCGLISIQNLGWKNMPATKLLIDNIGESIPAILPGESVYYKNACVAVLDDNGHSNGVHLSVFHDSGCKFYELEWEGEVSDRHRKAHANLSRAAEDGACVLAMLLIKDLTPYNTIEKAAYGTNVDYYVAPNQCNNDLIFNNTKRLEVSGICKEDGKNTVQKRLQEKIDRVKSDLPTYYCVIDFGFPWAAMVSCHE